MQFFLEKRKNCSLSQATWIVTWRKTISNWYRKKEIHNWVNLCIKSIGEIYELERAYRYRPRSTYRQAHYQRYTPWQWSSLSTCWLMIGLSLRFFGTILAWPMKIFKRVWCMQAICSEMSLSSTFEELIIVNFRNGYIKSHIQ